MKLSRVFNMIACITIMGCLFITASYAEEAPGKSTEQAVSAETPKTPENAAVVNGTTISYDTFVTEMELNQRRLQQQGRMIPEEMMPQLRSQVLDNLINQELLYQESARKQIKTQPETIEKELADIKSRFKDPKEFDATLKRMRMDEAGLRQQISQRSAIRTLIDQEIAAGITISDNDAKAFYDGNPSYFQRPEQVHARHILIKVAPDAKEADKTTARQKIDDIKKRIEKGEDFAELAKSVSEGPSSTKGGDLGFFSKEQMVKPFADAAFAMKPNEISDVVETRFGYHIIQMLEHRPAETAAFSDVKDRIVGNLRNERIQKEVHTYLEKLRNDAKIERNVQ